MKFFIFLLCATLVAGTAPFVNYTAPTNLRAEANINAIALFWEHEDENAVFLATLSDGQSEVTTERRIAFGGLEPGTTYLATVAQANEEGNAVSEEASISVVTLSAADQIRDLRVTRVTETSISVEWKDSEEIEFYVGSIQEENGDVIESLEIEDNNVTFMGLEPLTNYVVMVRSGGNGTQAGAASLNIRTDGMGVVRVIATWLGAGAAIGGEVRIFRPVNIPRGPYNVVVNFSCAVRSVKVWNAQFNVGESDLGAGLVAVTQSEIWELEKTDIGMTFYFSSFSSCSIGGTVPADFGVEFDSEGSAEPPAVDITMVPVSINEWFRDSRMIVASAGMGLIQLGAEYGAVQTSRRNSSNPKPLPGAFVIALNSGEGCPQGIQIVNRWSMTQKNTEGIAGALPGVTYFVQDLRDWHNNFPGFIYGYDPRVCGSRDITAQVITGATFIDDINNAPNV